MRAGSISRRCRCRDGDGRDLGAQCPKLKTKGHARWQVRQELPADTDGKRRTFRRSGFETRDAAQDVLDGVRSLLALATDDDEARNVGDLLDTLDKDEPLPEIEAVQRKLRAGLALADKGTMGDALRAWISQERQVGKIRRATLSSYESHIRLYLDPLIGSVRRDRLNVSHLIEMFAAIEDANDKIRANNEDRRAARELMKETGSRAQKRAIREQLAHMPPYRQPVGPTSMQRIRATLRTAINDLIRQQLMVFNPAQHVELPTPKTRPVVWTPSRIEEWRRTGMRPGTVLVWPPTIVGEFLDFVDEHHPEYAPMWRLLALRGPRRGETAGLRWVDCNLDEAYIDVTVQLVEVDYQVESGDPKSESGKRRIPLDAETVALLRQHRARQIREKLRLGPAWQESGHVFVKADGSPLRPSWISDKFEQLCRDADLPPIRTHDLRHCSATTMLAAGTDLKIIQETLGHSTLGTTSDLYTSVLPELSAAAAEATAAIVPRRRPFGHPTGTQEIDNVAEGGGGGRQ